MMNIIRADLYRIFRSKGFYITLAAFFALIAFLNVGGTFYIAGPTYGMERVVLDDGTVIFSPPEAVPEIIDETPAEFAGISEDFAFIIIPFLLPFIAFVASSDFSANTAKNALAGGVPRVKFYFSKLILACVFCVLTVFFGIALTSADFMVQLNREAGGGAFNTYRMEVMGQILRIFVAQLFMYIAVTCIGIFFAFATQRTAAANSAYLGFLFVPTVLLSMLYLSSPDSAIIETLFDYDIIMNIRMLSNIGAETGDIMRAFAIGGFYMLTSTICGILLFKRSEIK